VTYDKRKYARANWLMKPTSPSKRREPWITIMIRRDHYNMLREIKDYLDCTIGHAAMGAIEREFNRLLQEASPGAETFELVPPQPKKMGRPKGARDKRKRRKPVTAKARAKAKAEALALALAKTPRPTIQELLIPPPLTGPVDKSTVVAEPPAPDKPEPTAPRRKIYVPRF